MKRWKLWLPTLALAGMLAWWTVKGLQKDLLILNNGQSLTADVIYPVGGSVFYTDGITLDTVPRSQVRQIVFGSVAANFHNREAGLAEEIKTDVDILSDLSLFEGKYGPRGGALWPPS